MSLSSVCCTPLPPVECSELGLLGTVIQEGLRLLEDLKGVSYLEDALNNLTVEKLAELAEFVEDKPKAVAARYLPDLAKVMFECIETLERSKTSINTLVQNIYSEFSVAYATHYNKELQEEAVCDNIAFKIVLSRVSSEKRKETENRRKELIEKRATEMAAEMARKMLTKMKKDEEEAASKFRARAAENPENGMND